MTERLTLSTARPMSSHGMQYEELADTHSYATFCCGEPAGRLSNSRQTDRQIDRRTDRTDRQIDLEIE